MKKQTKTTLIWVVSIVALILILRIVNPSLFPFGVVSLGPNLVANPGYETQNPSVVGLPANWALQGTDSVHTVTWDSATYYSGTKSIKLTQTNGTKLWYGVNGDTFTVKPNTNYKVEFWYKTSNLPASTGTSAGPDYPNRVGINVNYLNSSGQRDTTWCDIYPTWVAGSSGWTQGTGICKTTATTAKIQPNMRLYSTTGTVWFDDISIKELVTDANVIISNPSFEIWNYATYKDTRPANQSEYNSAVSWYAGQFGAIIERTTEAHSGSYAFKLTAFPGHGSYIGQDLPTSFFQNGGMYEATAWVKKVSGTPGGKPFVSIQDKIPGNYRWVASAVSASGNTGTWEKLTYTFVIPTVDTTNGYRIAIDATANTTIIVDDVELKYIKQATMCTSNSQCSSTEICGTDTYSGGFCKALTCVSGYHSENHLCVVDTTPQPPKDNTIYYIIGAIVLAVIVIVIVKRRK